MQVSSIVYLEIPAPNFEDSKKFYAEAFNWKITESTMKNKPYAMFETGKTEMGLTSGGLNPDLLPLPEKSLGLYISVENIPEALKRVSKHGGLTLKEKTKISGDYGHYAVFKDPSGNHMCLWSKT